MIVTPGANVGRLDVNETVTGLWSFAHALGLLTDVINERTGTVGVTIDGVRMKDKGIASLLFTVVSEAMMRTQLTGDSNDRFILQAGGKLEWGPGNTGADTVLERIGVGALGISGNLQVAGALGLIADIITERTGGAGVTVDGVTLVDGSVSKPDAAAAGSIVSQSAVLGDAEFRHRRDASGRMIWGGGVTAPDTNLYRDVADTLKTDDSFVVGGGLSVNGEFRPLGTFDVSEKNTVLSSGANHDVDTGSVTLIRILGPGAVYNMTGFDGVVQGRIIGILNQSTSVGTINNQGAGSAVANRVMLPGAADITIVSEGMVWLIYDVTASKWKLLSHTT